MQNFTCSVLRFEEMWRCLVRAYVVSYLAVDMMAGLQPQRRLRTSCSLSQLMAMCFGLRCQGLLLIKLNTEAKTNKHKKRY